MKKSIILPFLIISFYSFSCETNFLLNKDALTYTFSFLPLEDLARAARVCKAWREVTHVVKELLKKKSELLLEQLTGEYAPPLVEINSLRLFLHNNNFCIPSDMIDEGFDGKGIFKGSVLDWLNEKEKELKAIKLLTHLDKIPPEIQTIKDSVEYIVREKHSSGFGGYPLTDIEKSNIIADKLSDIFDFEHEIKIKKVWKMRWWTKSNGEKVLLE